MRSEKLLTDSLGFLESNIDLISILDLISGGSSRGTLNKQNLYLEGETAFKARDASMLRSDCKAYTGSTTQPVHTLCYSQN